MKIEVKTLHEHFEGMFEGSLLQELADCGKYVEVEEGYQLMKPGGYIRSVPILLSGSVKIVRSDSEGLEALLYYLGGKDSCATSLTCCLVVFHLNSIPKTFHSILVPHQLMGSQLLVVENT